MKDKRMRLDGIFNIVAGCILIPLFIMALIYSHPSTLIDYCMLVIFIAFFGGIITIFMVIGVKHIEGSKNTKK